MMPKPKRQKLTTLKPGLQSLDSCRLQTLQRATTERKRGNAGVKDRERIKRRDGWLCQECKRQGFVRMGTEVDHIQPLWDGGTDDDSNKELLCAEHHAEKTAREAKERAGAA